MVGGMASTRRARRQQAVYASVFWSCASHSVGGERGRRCGRQGGHGVGQLLGSELPGWRSCRTAAG